MMNSIKCSKCGLSNFASEVECRRCGTPLFISNRTAERPRRSGRSSLITLVICASLIVGGYYLYNGMKSSMEEVNKSEESRVKTEIPQKPEDQGLSRTESDQKRAARVGDTIRENPNIEAQRQHNEEMQKAIQQASNGGH